jgi:undecaprenyl-diphosphatase
MTELIKAIILGIVEGFTEFLPVSSTGHLIIVNQFINFTGKFAQLFDIVIQLGAILAVLIYFRHKLFPLGRGKNHMEKVATWDIWKKTVIGVIPALILGAMLGEHIEAYLFNPVTVAIALFLGGIILVFIERRSKQEKINSIASLSYTNVLLIGLIQCLAMIPGTSRSAVTIIGAMLLGTSRIVAAEFSFFLAIPTLVAASAYSLLKTGFVLNVKEIQLLATGFIVAFFIAWLVIAGFMKFIFKSNFKVFGYYRILLGIFILIYFGLIR